jgi:hypothetical protein
VGVDFGLGVFDGDGLLPDDDGLSEGEDDRLGVEEGSWDRVGEPAVLVPSGRIEATHAMPAITSSSAAAPRAAYTRPRRRPEPSDPSRS